MAEIERREDAALKKCLKEAYGYSDEQVLKEMEEAEQSLSDSDFPGAEERIYQKIMEREAAEKKAANSNASEGKKVVRFGRKKIFLVAILAAAFVGLLGLTAVGEKSYFFRMREKKTGIVFNNENNIQEISSLERAYEEIEGELDIQVLKLGYMPEDMKFDEIVTQEYRAQINFNYNGNKVHFVQVKKERGASVGINSDRNEEETIWNDWIKKDINYRKNVLNDGQVECEAHVAINEVIYHLSGIMESDEFVKVIKNLTFY